MRKGAASPPFSPVRCSPSAVLRLRLAGVPLRPAWPSLCVRQDETDGQIASTTSKDTAMNDATSNTGTHTKEARFLAPRTVQQAVGFRAMQFGRRQPAATVLVC